MSSIAICSPVRYGASSLARNTDQPSHLDGIAVTTRWGRLDDGLDKLLRQAVGGLPPGRARTDRVDSDGQVHVLDGCEPGQFATAPLAAKYAGIPGNTTGPAIDAVLMMVPPPLAKSGGLAWFMPGKHLHR